MTLTKPSAKLLMKKPSFIILSILTITTLFIVYNYEPIEAQIQIIISEKDARDMWSAILEFQEKDVLQAKQESDQRRNTAILLINNTIKPQLATPSGDYLTQHSQILSNIRFLENEIGNAQNGEMADKLRKLLDLELADFKQLKQNHAQGIIT